MKKHLIIETTTGQATFYLQSFASYKTLWKYIKRLSALNMSFNAHWERI